MLQFVALKWIPDSIWDSLDSRIAESIFELLEHGWGSVDDYWREISRGFPSN